ncbi:hypothetical protein CF078_01960 [Clostridium botulinum]|nr:hypothetical protein [Clostridium botulinum]MBN3353806.1 hypothetical protein [Clostridium botulinum]QDY29212.1 hypothetical protein CGQ41_10530 [Clostridium botulinum]
MKEILGFIEIIVSSSMVSKGSPWGCEQYIRFLYCENVFRFIYKFKGEPYRNKCLNPYKKDNILSTFVILKDRYKRVYIISLLGYNKSIVYEINCYKKMNKQNNL